MLDSTIDWRFIVGIDISKQYLDLYLWDRKTDREWTLQVTNGPDGFDRIDQWLDGHRAGRSQTVLVSEHTGRYGEHLLRWTSNANWPHAVVKTTALEKVGDDHHRKDDAFDARHLAEYGYRFHDRLPLTEAPSPAVGQLKRLQAERRKMVDRRAALKSKLTEAATHDADMDRLIHMWKQQLALLGDHINQLEQSIGEIIEGDSQLSSHMQRMQTAPGMGKVLTPFWLGLFAGQQQLDPRKISSRFGFAPHSRQSGSSVNKPDQSTGYGNSEMRRLMHQAARSVANHKVHYHEYYQRKRKEGKHELVVINNIINKLIRLYCAMWNRQVAYDPNYIEKNKHQWKKSA